MTSPSTDDTPPAGWYPDPENRPGMCRYWDGAGWVGVPRKATASGRPRDTLGIVSLFLLLLIPASAVLSGLPILGGPLALLAFLAIPIVSIVAIVNAHRGKYSARLGIIALCVWGGIGVLAFAALMLLVLALGLSGV